MAVQRQRLLDSCRDKSISLLGINKHAVALRGSEDAVETFVQHYQQFCRTEEDELGPETGSELSDDLALELTPELTSSPPTSYAPAVENLVVGASLCESSTTAPHNGGLKGVHPSIINKIGELTGCSIEHGGKSASGYPVEGQITVSLQKALQKLPITRNFLCSENETNTRFALKALNDTHDYRIFNSLGFISNANRTLSSQFVVMLLDKYGDVIPIKEQPRSLAHAQLWFGRWFKEIGMVHCEDKITDSEDLKSPDNKVKAWLNETPMSPGAMDDEIPPISGPLSVIEADQSQPDFVTTKRNRKVKVTQVADQETQRFIPEVVYRPANTMLRQQPSTQTLPSIAISPVAGLSESGARALPPVINAAETSNANSLYYDQVAREHKMLDGNENIHHRKVNGNDQEVLGDSLLDASNDVLHQLRMPSLLIREDSAPQDDPPEQASKTSRFINITTNEHPLNDPGQPASALRYTDLKDGSKTELLIDLTLDESQEAPSCASSLHLSTSHRRTNKQSGSTRKRKAGRTNAKSQSQKPESDWTVASDGRTHDIIGLPSTPKENVIHYTMRQKTPNRTPLIDEDLEQKETMLAEMLDLARSFAGPLVLKIEFGRFLIDPVTLPIVLRNKRYSKENLTSVMCGKESIRPSFINRLTTKVTQAESMLDLKLRAGKTLFEREPQDWIVTHEIHCSTPQGEDVVIIIHEDSTYHISPVKRVVGALNLFYPKRAWDARLVVQGSECLGGSQKADFDGIVQSFKVSPRPLSLKNEVNITFQVPSTAFKIKGLIARRETIHQTQYPDLQLRLTEVFDASCKAFGEIPTSFVGALNSTLEMSAMDKVWWTASIHSIKANAILKSNESLALGEQAGWSPQGVLQGGVIRDLLSITEDVVTRIDHIGLRI
ncbi:uncharacterized protein KY384_004178 [Bacidia gigantensis]|uniref:uncharacterized protein n=1 Tax=Bacidia gigantensis TaxID=2732470 RepID=UPI001D05547D|nr:uncharacterized protein KY384_004178 [Bacidia gigantensis]KAG8530821.1 hypothetical protein KY384_004178 [Bacidia gigantensis]